MESKLDQEAIDVFKCSTGSSGSCLTHLILEEVGHRNRSRSVHVTKPLANFRKRGAQRPLVREWLDRRCDLDGPATVVGDERVEVVVVLLLEAAPQSESLSSDGPDDICDLHREFHPSAREEFTLEFQNREMRQC